MADKTKAERPVTVWERPERGARGPAPERSRAQITKAAIELADQEGLNALSLRALAKRLGTGPASLYRYVSGRDDLLDLMADAVAGEIDLGVPLDGDPVTDLANLAVRAKAVYLRHPWLAELAPEPLRAGPNGLSYLDRALEALEPSGLSGQAAVETVAIMSALVTLFAQTELQRHRTPTGRQVAQAVYLTGAASSGHYPRLATALAGGAPEDLLADPDALFVRVIRQVLTGLIDRTPEEPEHPHRSHAT
ncbi:TetR/AcrR family transcriptional regulator [Actinomadura sp. 6N118]|uniref:TetR/AcrR family transcriptional regulator n=1 Tax=Actinomadura sp. 6N118 TaxID=3375151 RepID=UPI003791EC4E